ncbi:hypothetical protein BDV09DRAFT_168385 [Aspergillus tetrazonus]
MFVARYLNQPLNYPPGSSCLPLQLFSLASCLKARGSLSHGYPQSMLEEKGKTDAWTALLKRVPAAKRPGRV